MVNAGILRGGRGAPMNSQEDGMKKGTPLRYGAEQPISHRN